KTPPCAHIAIYKTESHYNVSWLVLDGLPCPYRTSYPNKVWSAASPRPPRGPHCPHCASLRGLYKQMVRIYPMSPHMFPSKMGLSSPGAQAVHQGCHPYCPSRTP